MEEPQEQPQRTCPHCGRVIGSAHQAPPRFCPNCGAWLGVQDRHEEPDAPTSPEAAEEAPEAPVGTPVLRAVPRRPGSPAANNPWTGQSPPPELHGTPLMGDMRRVFRSLEEEQGRLLTGSRAVDGILGFLAVAMINLALPGAIRQFVEDLTPSVGSGVTLYIASLVVYLAVLRSRYPAFARGWSIGLIMVLAVFCIGILLILLLILGIIALCSGLGGGR